MRRECRKRFPRHHGLAIPICITACAVPWCMSGSLTSGFLWSQYRGKHSRQFRRMHDPRFYVSGKRPMGNDPDPNVVIKDNGLLSSYYFRTREFCQSLRENGTGATDTLSRGLRNCLHTHCYNDWKKDQWPNVSQWSDLHVRVVADHITSS